MPTTTVTRNGWAVTDARHLAQIAAQAYRSAMPEGARFERPLNMPTVPAHVMTHIAACAGLTWALVRVGCPTTETAQITQLCEDLDAALEALRLSEVVWADGVDAAASVMERFHAETV